LRNEPPDEGTSDPDENRNYDPTRIIARHDQLAKLSLPSAPAISPIMIQTMMPVIIFLSPFLAGPAGRLIATENGNIWAASNCRAGGEHGDSG
jgi:hypothetical protein